MEKTTKPTLIFIYRKQNRLSQMQFANMIGVSQTQIYKWEKRITCPDAQDLIKLKKVMKKSYKALIEDYKKGE